MPREGVRIEQRSFTDAEMARIIKAAPEGITLRKGDTSMFTAIQQSFNEVKSDGTYNTFFQTWHLNTTQELP